MRNKKLCSILVPYLVEKFLFNTQASAAKSQLVAWKVEMGASIEHQTRVENAPTRHRGHSGLSGRSPDQVSSEECPGASQPRGSEEHKFTNRDEGGVPWGHENATTPPPPSSGWGTDLEAGVVVFPSYGGSWYFLVPGGVVVFPCSWGSGVRRGNATTPAPWFSRPPSSLLKEAPKKVQKERSQKKSSKNSLE